MAQTIEKNAAGIPVRPFGNTGEKVTIVGVGGGHICRKHVSEDLTVRIVQTAIDEGVNFLDNAWEYWDGESERRFGLALKGRRDKVLVMTKVCGRDRKTAEQHLHDSLRRLQTEMIDVWQFHEINYDNDPDWIFGPGGAIEAALAARDAGKVRFIGFTGHKSPHIHLKMLQQELLYGHGDSPVRDSPSLYKNFPWDTCQLPINVADAHYRSFQQKVLPELNRRGIAAIGMKSLGGDAQLVEGAGLTARQCRRYALSLPISTLVCGMESLENLRQDLDIARHFTPLADAEKAELLERVRPAATDGRHEWFKSTQYYDSKIHRQQHGFPPIAAVGGE